MLWASLVGQATSEFQGTVTLKPYLSISVGGGGGGGSETALNLRCSFQCILGVRNDLFCFEIMHFKVSPLKSLEKENKAEKVSSL